MNTETNATAQNEEPQVESVPEINKEEIIKNSAFATPFVVERNGVKVTATPFVGAARSKSKWSGVPWVAPQVGTIEGQDGEKGYEHDSIFHHGMKFIGRTNVVNALNIILRRYGQDFLTDSTDPLTGKLNLETYHKTWAELATSALKISELEELLDEEQKKQEKAIEDMMPYMTKLGAGDTLETADQAKFSDLSKGVKERTAKISSYRQQIANRKKKPSQEKQADTVAPV